MIEVNAVQLAKAFEPIDVILFLIVISVTCALFANAYAPVVVMLEGTTIDVMLFDATSLKVAAALLSEVDNRDVIADRDKGVETMNVSLTAFAKFLNDII
jgi:hypothetical protein